MGMSGKGQGAEGGQDARRGYLAVQSGGRAAAGGKDMKLKIMNCYEDEIEVDIGELDNISEIQIRVLSGDEILRVTKKDGTTIEEDSDRHCRVMDFFDGEYTIYDQAKGTNRIKEWEKRQDSNEWIM